MLGPGLKWPQGSRLFSSVNGILLRRSKRMHKRPTWRVILIPDPTLVLFGFRRFSRVFQQQLLTFFVHLEGLEPRKQHISEQIFKVEKVKSRLFGLGMHFRSNLRSPIDSFAQNTSCSKKVCQNPSRNDVEKKSDETCLIGLVRL